ncbi:hypothetical protein FACUT_13227 [Fusarium acutatum]|uniref:Uncharacterized protein n=1 Tax=Fusarium acutatum TaxID=78861 RepID=A0A8H4N8X3_9HYPO|nr:hypothetical protein FACUT_13227 [Fusarium acutatum]
MAEDEKTLAQQVEALKKENQQQRINYDSAWYNHHRRELLAKQENERLKSQIKRLQMELLEVAERQTRIMKAQKAKDVEEKEKLQEENRVLKQALAGVESAIAPLKKL